VEQPTPDSAALFAEAYRTYLRAVQRAWSEVDVDALAQDMTDGRQGLQGCGEAFSSLGSLGTFGTIGTAYGTFGSIGTAGTFGCAVTEEPGDEADQAGYTQEASQDG
jgi:hypothetical protein